MKRKSLLGARVARVLVVALLGAPLVVADGGCVFHARARAVWVVDSEPPPPRYVTVTPRPGYVWIRGHWEWIGGRWQWQSGHWVRERAGSVWVHGEWVHRGGRWEWREGRWETRAKARDHRDDDRPKVRDHR